MTEMAAPLDQRIEAVARAIYIADLSADTLCWDATPTAIRDIYVRLAKAAADALDEMAMEDGVIHEPSRSPKMPEAYETKEGTKSYNDPNNPAFEVAVNGVLQALQTYDIEDICEQVSRTKFFEVFTSDKVAWHFDPAVVWAEACKRSWLGFVPLDETVPKTIVYNVDPNWIEKIMAIQKAQVADNIKYLSLVSPEELPDNVNHPSHYIYDGVEVIQLTEQMNFNRGNAVKYIARAGRKDPQDELVDLEKAAWHIQREIERLRKGVYKDGGTEKP